MQAVLRRGVLRHADRLRHLHGKSPQVPDLHAESILRCSVQRRSIGGGFVYEGKVTSSTDREQEGEAATIAIQHDCPGAVKAMIEYFYTGDYTLSEDVIVQAFGVKLEAGADEGELIHVGNLQIAARFTLL